MASVAFFDIGDTLGAVRVNAEGTGIEKIGVYPGVLDALTALRAGGVSLGIISNRGSIPAADVEAALDRAGLLELFDPHLIVYGRKDSALIFESAAGRVPPPRRLLFVGEDVQERWFARAAGFEVCPHARLAPGVLLGPPAPLRFLRVRVPDGEAGLARLRALPVVPLHLTDGPELYAVADTATALELDDLGFWVDRLGADDEPATSELYLLRTDGPMDGRRTAGTFADAAMARRVLASTADGLYVAVPAGRTVDSLHLGAARHGHNLKLTAMPALLAEPAVAALPVETLVEAAPAPPDPAVIALVQSEITTSRIEETVGRYSGSRPLRPGVTLRSRHIQHADNAQAVAGLVADLTALGGLTVRTHRFTEAGLTLDNVEGTLPGSGLPGVVVVSAHLDSTAANDFGYQPATDPAPGADDDASGVASVLAAARAVLALAAAHPVPRREFRFVLFNAEEQGFVGSRAYVRDQRALGVDIVAALQLDMIGYDVAPGRAFELHAGYSKSAAVEQRSVGLAEQVAAVAGAVSPGLPAPQVYPVPGMGDLGQERSDHYSFHINGFPACLASEDFFVGPGSGAPAPDPNPNYHSFADTTITGDYTRDICRVVTTAAWISGTR
jgi:hypothetical protein